MRTPPVDRLPPVLRRRPAGRHAPADPDACTRCSELLCAAFPDCPADAPHMSEEHTPDA